jgi:hypothetical protein
MAGSARGLRDSKVDVADERSILVRPFIHGVIPAPAGIQSSDPHALMGRSGFPPARE